MINSKRVPVDANKGWSARPLSVGVKQLFQVLWRSKAGDNSESHIIILYFLCVLYWVLSLFFFFD